MEKIEIGYTVPKERWKEAAENLEELGNRLANILILKEKGQSGKDAADDLMADIMLACLALNHVAEFAVDKCRIIPMPGNK